MASICEHVLVKAEVRVLVTYAAKPLSETPAHPLV